MPSQKSTTIRPLRHPLQQHQPIHMPAHNYAEKTRHGYAKDLRDLLRFLHEQGRRRLTQLPPDNLVAYLAHLDARGLAGATPRRKTYALTSFFAFLNGAGKIPDKPSETLIAPRTEQNEPRVLSSAEYQAVLCACSHHPCDAAIIELVLQTGIRLSGLTGRQTGDIALPGDITKETDTVGRHHILGKGRTTRWIPLNCKACRAIKAWLDM